MLIKMDSLNWTEQLLIDESFEKINYDEYSPHTGINLNNIHGDIRILIQNQDQFLLPHKSYLYIEAELLKEDDDENYELKEDIALVNNAIMYLFNRVSYEIDSKEIEGYSYPGITTTVHGLLNYPSDYSDGTQFLWKTDGNKAFKQNKGFNVRKTFVIGRKNKFSCIVPLDHIFSFCKTYQKIMYGVRHSLILRRNHNNDVIYKSDVLTDGGEDLVEDGKVSISKLSWFMPNVTISDEYKIRLYENIKNKINIPIRFLSRQCERYTLSKNTTELDWRLTIASGSERARYVFLVFQDDRLDNQKKNTAVFDHINLRNVYCQLNSERYPEYDLAIDFDNHMYVRPYKMLTDYISDVLGKENSSIGLMEFANTYPILVFDLSHQSERLKNTPVDIRIRGSFSKNISNDNVEAYAIILSDRFINLQSDGNQMNAIY